MHSYRRGDLVFDITDQGRDDSDVVILLHGFPQHRRTWDAVSPHLVDAGYRTVAPDQRGYSPGARPSGRRAYVTRELVDDVVALIDTLGRDTVHVVGHDWGALVAWALASSHPDRLRSLTAVSVPHPAAFLAAMRHGQALRSWYMGFFQLPLVPETVLGGRLGAAALARTGLPRAAAQAYLDALGRDGLTAALNWYRALPLGRDAEYGHRTSVPTLYVWSDRDTALGRAGAEATGRYVTGPYRFEVFEDLPHWIPETVPDRLATVVAEHLASVGRPPA